MLHKEQHSLDNNQNPILIANSSLMSGNPSQSYKVHSNNSPDDDLSITTPGGASSGKKMPQRLKWILVREGNENQR